MKKLLSIFVCLLVFSLSLGLVACNDSVPIPSSSGSADATQATDYTATALVQSVTIYEGQYVIVNGASGTLFNTSSANVKFATADTSKAVTGFYASSGGYALLGVSAGTTTIAPTNTQVKPSVEVTVLPLTETYKGTFASTGATQLVGTDDDVNMTVQIKENNTVHVSYNAFTVTKDADHVDLPAYDGDVTCNVSGSTIDESSAMLTNSVTYRQKADTVNPVPNLVGIMITFGDSGEISDVIIAFKTDSNISFRFRLTKADA